MNEFQQEWQRLLALENEARQVYDETLDQIRREKYKLQERCPHASGVCWLEDGRQDVLVCKDCLKELDWRDHVEGYFYVGETKEEL